MSKPRRRVARCAAIAWIITLMIATSAYAQPNPILIPQRLVQLQAGQLQAIPLQAGQGNAEAPAVMVIAGHHDMPTTQPAIRPQPDVQSLVDQLAADSFTDRQSAFDSLSRMGRSIEPQLRGALDEHVTPEATSRLEALIAQLNQWGDYGPSVITIHAQAAPMKKVLQDFAEQADADIVIRSDAALAQINQSNVSIDLDHATFWDALRQMETICAAPLSVGSGEINFGQVQGQAVIPITDAPGTIIGPFFIQPAATTINRTLTYSANPGPATGTVSVRFTVNCEPKVTIVNNQLSCTGFQNTDDQGHALATISAQGQILGSLNGRTMWNLTDIFREVPGMGSHLKSVKANLQFSVQTAKEVVDIPDLIHAQGQTRTLDGGTLTVLSASADNGQFTTKLSYAGPVNPAPAATTISNNPFGLAQYLDDSGRQLPASNIQMQRNITNNSSTWIWTSVVQTANGTPSKLRYEITTDSRSMTVPIELHDLELPVGPTTLP